MSRLLAVSLQTEDSARPEGGRGAPALGGGAGAVRAVGPDGSRFTRSPMARCCETPTSQSLREDDR